MNYNQKELHDNFIVLHDFLHKDEPIKGWVRSDERYNGNYHDDYDTIMEIWGKINDSEIGAICIDHECVYLHLNGGGMNVYKYSDYDTKKLAIYASCIDCVKHHLKALA